MQSLCVRAAKKREGPGKIKKKSPKKPKSKTKKCYAYETLKDMIFRHELPLGEMISETFLAERLGMSRTPIREALQLLATEGFIKVIPKQGIIVQDVSITEAWEIYEIRLALEQFVIGRIIEKTTPEHIIHLREIIEKQKACMESNDIYQFMVHDSEMHMYLFQIYENSKMREFTEKLRARFFTVGLKALRKTGRMQSSVEEHVKMVDALERKDLQAALSSLEQHLEHGKQHVI